MTDRTTEERVRLEFMDRMLKMPLDELTTPQDGRICMLNRWWVPEAQCPKCKRWQDDHDGFGVLKCEHCDYCSHASITGGVCGLCGASEGKPGEPR